MTDTKATNTEKPIYYVDLGNNTWIDNMGQQYTLSELATAIKKREQEEIQKYQSGLKTVFVEQGNAPIVQEPAPSISAGPQDVLMISESIHAYRQIHGPISRPIRNRNCHRNCRGLAR